MAVKIGSLFGDVTLSTKNLDKGIRQANKKLRAFGRTSSGLGKQIAVGIGAPLSLVGGMAVKTFAGFEQSMAKVKAVSGATADEFNALEASAKKLGSSTRFTATQV